MKYKCNAFHPCWPYLLTAFRPSHADQGEIQRWTKICQDHLPDTWRPFDFWTFHLWLEINVLFSYQSVWLVLPFSIAILIVGCFLMFVTAFLTFEIPLTSLSEAKLYDGSGTEVEKKLCLRRRWHGQILVFSSWYCYGEWMRTQKRTNLNRASLITKHR